MKSLWCPQFYTFGGYMGEDSLSGAPRSARGGHVSRGGMIIPQEFQVNPYSDAETAWWTRLSRRWIIGKGRQSGTGPKALFSILTGECVDSSFPEKPDVRYAAVTLPQFLYSVLQVQRPQSFLLKELADLVN